MFGRHVVVHRSFRGEFSRKCPEEREPMGHTTAYRLTKRFKESVSVADHQRCGRPNMNKHSLWFWRMFLKRLGIQSKE